MGSLIKYVFTNRGEFVRQGVLKKVYIFFFFIKSIFIIKSLFSVGVL